MPIKPMTKSEWLNHLEQISEDFGLQGLPAMTLATYCQAIGQSGRGTKQQLIARLERAIRKPR